MPTRLSFDFYGDQQLDRTLERFELGATDASPAFEKIGDSLARAERRQFKSEGNYGSAGWAPLAPRTVRERQRLGYGGEHPILVRTGDLRDSLTVRPFGVDVVETQFAVFGSGVDYGLFHQQGGDNLPQRRPIELPETLRRRWVKILQRWIMTGKALEE